MGGLRGVEVVLQAGPIFTSHLADCGPGGPSRVRVERWFAAGGILVARGKNPRLENREIETCLTYALCVSPGVGRAELVDAWGWL